MDPNDLRIPELTRFFTRRLQLPLPGTEAQFKMVPDAGGGRFRVMKPGPDAKTSAVLVLLHPGPDGQTELLFTLRTATLGAHGGQLSFPGGRMDPGETPEETALREAQEEVGLDPALPQLLGRLSPMFVHVSNNLVQPVVAVLDRVPDLVPSPDEVAEIIHVPLQVLLQPGLRKYHRRSLEGIEYDIPYWDVHPTTPLWGATAMILAELLALLQEQVQD